MKAMTLGRHLVRFVLAGVMVVGGVALDIERGEAHKSITSQYTYNDDVFPIFRDRCSRCHVAGRRGPDVADDV